MGDFVHGTYEATLRRSEDRVQLQLCRQGRVSDCPLQITKGITLGAVTDGSIATLEIAYLLENVPEGPVLHFAPELNFAGLPGGAEERFFRDSRGESMGHLGSMLDLSDSNRLDLVDQWLGMEVGLQWDRPTGIWTYPVETVSQSEGGFELIHQSVVVQPHWIIEPDANRRWSVTIGLKIDTRLAESRMDLPVAAAAV